MNSLKHVGVKGMRWGVRKKREDTSDSDRIVVLKKGETVQHITDNPNLSPGVRELYTSFTKKDMLMYRAEYADQVRTMRDIDTIYSYKLKATKDLVAPTQKKKIDELIGLMKDEPAVLSEIAETKLSYGLIMQTVKALGLNDTKKQAQKYREQLLSKNPKDQEKTLKDYVQFMAITPNARMKYLKRLEKQGFNSMYDDNDMLSGYSEKPLIVFNSKKNLKVSSKEMDDQAATDRVFSELEKLIKETN